MEKSPKKRSQPKGKKTQASETTRPAESTESKRQEEGPLKGGLDKEIPFQKLASEDIKPKNEEKTASSSYGAIPGIKAPQKSNSRWRCVLGGGAMLAAVSAASWSTWEVSKARKENMILKEHLEHLEVKISKTQNLIPALGDVHGLIQTVENQGKAYHTQIEEEQNKQSEQIKELEKRLRSLETSLEKNAPPSSRASAPLNNASSEPRAEDSVEKPQLLNVLESLEKNLPFSFEPQKWQGLLSDDLCAEIDQLSRKEGPTLEKLEAEFKACLPQLMRHKYNDDESLQKALSNFFTFRKIGEALDPNSFDGKIYLLEKALKEQKFDEVLKVYTTLPEAAQKELKEWRDHVSQRHQRQKIIHHLREQLQAPPEHILSLLSLTSILHNG